jgi:hypothetical protein
LEEEGSVLPVEGINYYTKFTKVDKTDSCNYRRIQILLAKQIFFRILLTSLTPCAEGIIGTFSVDS